MASAPRPAGAAGAAGPRALQQQGQIALAAQQGLQPVDKAQRGVFAAFASRHVPAAAQSASARRWRRVPRSAATRGFSARLRTRASSGQLLRPGKSRRPGRRRQPQRQGRRRRRHFWVLRRAAARRTRRPRTRAPSRRSSSWQAVAVTNEAEPRRRSSAGRRRRGQAVGLLVVQELDAVLDPAQEDIGGLPAARRSPAASARAPPALQRLDGGAGADLGELAAAHHLHQLHDELDLADAAARELDVVGRSGRLAQRAWASLADLAVQLAQASKTP